MKKYILLPALMMLPTAMFAQSAVDAYNLSQNELRGTARFMSMAGAFTALGGDLSTLNQNPAGIGVYRGNDIGITFDLNMMSSKTNDFSSWDKTHFDVNNVGYVGTVNIGGDVMQSFSWGVSYGRRNSFERHYKGSGLPMSTSLSNFIAINTDGVDASKMSFAGGLNPYSSTDISRLSILAYTSGLITPVPMLGSDGKYYDTTEYDGLFEYGSNGVKPSTGTADFMISERGYVDEYSINFGGNLANTVYWGLGVGITDMNYEQSASYVETIQGANVPAKDGVGVEEGDCDYQLDSYQKIDGTGVNLKVGVIIKPVNEFRIGLAVHTPTYYSLHKSYDGAVDFGSSISSPVSEYTDLDYYDWNLRTPWRLMAGVAGVIGGRGIISADYEYQAYQDMKSSDDYGDFDIYNNDVKDYFKASHTFRLGAEYRLSPNFSVRAGYSYVSSAAKDIVKSSDITVYNESSCNPSYTLDNSTNYGTFGLGYRSGGFYLDLAYVYKHTSATYRAFGSFNEYTNYWEDAPSASVKLNSNNVVLTLGYKF
jgi:hypothetical protein